jgi:tetratricopeptide (TPR) repeat protein
MPTLQAYGVTVLGLAFVVAVATASADEPGPRQVLQEASAVARAIKDPAEQTYALRRIELATVSLAIKDGHLEEALRRAEALPERWKSQAKLQVAQAQAKAGDLDGAFRTAASIIPGRWLAEVPIRHVAFSLATAGSIPSAIQIASQIQRDDVRSMAFADIAVAQAQRGDVAGAMGTVRSVESVPARAEALGHTALIQHSSGEVDAAAATLEQAYRLGLTEPAANQRGRLFDWLIETAVHMGDLTRAHQFLGQVEPAKQLFPRSSIAFGEAKAGDIVQAQKTWPEVYANGYVAAAHAEAGRFAEALQAVNAARDATERARALQHIALVQARSGLGSAATATFDQALQAASRILDYYARACAIRVVATAEAHAGDFKGAVAMVAAIRPERERAEAFMRIAAIQAEHGHTRQALAWIARLRSPLERARALIGVVEGELGQLGAPAITDRFERRLGNRLGCGYGPPSGR